MLVIVDKNRAKAVKKYAAKDANVLVIAEPEFKADDDLKDRLEKLFKKTQVARLTPAERKTFSKVSLDNLWRMARGEIQGYTVMPALDTILDQLRNKEYAVEAVEILGRLPGKEIQYKLAGIVTDPARGKLRLPAAMELNRHIQKHGLQLDKKQLADLNAAYQAAGDDLPLRTQLTVTASLIGRSTSAQTGAQLFQFSPDVPAAPKEKEEKKEKDN